jgi:hypothetical protein
MRNAIMTPKFSELLSELLQEWGKSEYKATNYTDTYSRNALLNFLTVVRDWTMFQHCIEDREAMTQRDKQDREDWWENAMIDKRAEEEAEHRDSLDKYLRD